MAKSRTAPWLAAALISSPAAAFEPVTIEQLIERQRAEVEAAIRPTCDRGDEEDIVVCGAREDQRRFRVPPLAMPGARAAQRAGGEQRAALAIDTSPCTTVGRDQRCNAGLDVIGIALTIARSVAQALLNRD